MGRASWLLGLLAVFHFARTAWSVSCSHGNVSCPTGGCGFDFWCSDSKSIRILLGASEPGFPGYLVVDDKTYQMLDYSSSDWSAVSMEITGHITRTQLQFAWGGYGSPIYGCYLPLLGDTSFDDCRNTSVVQKGARWNTLEGSQFLTTFVVTKEFLKTLEYPRLMFAVDGSDVDMRLSLVPSTKQGVAELKAEDGPLANSIESDCQHVPSPHYLPSHDWCPKDAATGDSTLNLPVADSRASLLDIVFNVTAVEAKRTLAHFRKMWPELMQAIELSVASGMSLMQVKSELERRAPSLAMAGWLECMLCTIGVLAAGAIIVAVMYAVCVGCGLLSAVTAMAGDTGVLASLGGYAATFAANIESLGTYLAVKFPKILVGLAWATSITAPSAISGFICYKFGACPDPGLLTYDLAGMSGLANSTQLVV